MKIFLLILFYIASAEALVLKGVATSLSSKEHIYTELHDVSVTENGLNKKIQTKYSKPNGDFFAEMVSDFSKNPTIPDVKFTDQRFEKSEELNFDIENNRIIFKTTTKDKKVVTKTHQLTKDMAAGQGFDNFVKINFDQLNTATVPLYFGVLSEMDFFTFKGYKKKDLNNNVVQFGIELSSFLLRMFSSELILEYDKKTKQILSYQGLSNILNDQGKSQDVLIKYSHSVEAPPQ